MAVALPPAARGAEVEQQQQQREAVVEQRGGGGQQPQQRRARHRERAQRGELRLTSSRAALAALEHALYTNKRFPLNGSQQNTLSCMNE